MLNLDIDGYLSAVDTLRIKEAFLAKPEWDKIGKVWNIGYGTTIYPNGKRVLQTDPEITEAEAYSYLCHYMNICLESCNKCVTANANVNQSKAILILAYNIGIENFKNSTLLKVINQNINDTTAIANQWKRWIYANGVIINGLKNRRTTEWRIFVNNPTATLF